MSTWGGCEMVNTYLNLNYSILCLSIYLFLLVYNDWDLENHWNLENY